MINLQQAYDEYKERVGDIDKILYICLNEPNRNLVDSILSMSINELKNKTPLELNESAIILSQYCIFLQNYENKCKDFRRWIHKTLNFLSNDDKCRANNWLISVDMRLQKLSYLCKRIDNMIQCLLNLSKTKQFS